jgi:hypothetical protein
LLALDPDSSKRFFSKKKLITDFFFSGLQQFGDRLMDSSKRVVVKKLIDFRQAEIEAYFNRRLQRGGGGGYYFASFLGGSQV